jgi:hypothetical protein
MYSALPLYEIPWKPNPKYRISDEPSMSSTFSFWLPDGIELKGDFGTEAIAIYKNFTNRLNHVEEACKKYFQLDDEVFR